ncbi:MAG: hypothetical protein GPJ54_00300, partial [Candidatus Heimdallarchaeota archaeon]|nr:hypothetical protein [Candidatus Heimdallarchaeota archaeon]
PYEHRQSIKKLNNYDFKHLIVGHGHPVEYEAKEMLNTLVSSGTLD